MSIKHWAKTIMASIFNFFVVDSAQMSALRKEPGKAKQNGVETGEIHAALEKWQTARRYFENANDPDVIDYAIFDMESSRRRYTLLLKNAKTTEYTEYDTTQKHKDVSG